jgi:4-alpha-glucanotransferase
MIGTQIFQQDNTSPKKAQTVQPFVSLESGLSNGLYNQILDKLATSCGIEPEYRDNWGHLQTTSPETNRSILQAIGLSVDTESQAASAWRERQSSAWGRMTEPTIVATLSSLPTSLLVRIRQKDRPGLDAVSERGLEGMLEVTDEHGHWRRFQLTPHTVSHLETIRAEHGVYDCWRVSFPPLQGFGYYRFHLSVKVDGQLRSETLFVAICPEQAYIPPRLREGQRTAGIAISLYGVRSERNWGIGDFADLIELVDWVVNDLHGNILGLNPLHALFNRSPFNTSPYLPMSRFYRNFVYIDVPGMSDYKDSPEAQGFVNTLETQRLLRDLRASPTVRYEEVAALKEKVLRQVFKTFLVRYWKTRGEKTASRKALEKYITTEGVFLENFATFCALDAVMRARIPGAWTWPDWPPAYRRPDSDEVRRFREEHWEEVLFHQWVQWQIEKQLEDVQTHARSLGMCVGLYHDLALAADRFSADFWAYQDFYLSRLHVGAPPDAFAQQGQDWGVPPPNMERLREAGYHLFIKEVQKNCCFGGALRIDHVMRFFHLFCIPEEEPATRGAYLSQPFEDLLRIVCLESHRNEVMIVGEDLGTVPGYVRSTLSEMSVLSYRLLYFEKDGQQRFLPPGDYPELALVTISTQDLPTLVGFWTHTDIELRRKTGMLEDGEAFREVMAKREVDKARLLALLHEENLLPEVSERDVKAYPEISGELHEAVTAVLARTPCKIFMLTQEDLFKEKDQQNLPGTTGEYPNWSLKMKYTVEQLRSDPRARAFCDMFRNVVDRSGRNR